MHELLEKSIKEASTYFQNFFIHEYATTGPLHQVDARLKLFGTVVLIVLAVSTFDAPKVIFVLISLLLIAKLSNISLKTIVKRIWLFSLFSFIVVTPLAVENPQYGAVFTLRVIAALVAIQMLVMTTPFNEIVFALRSFRVPEIFVLALWLGYRYTLLMFRELVGILIARESRRVAKTSHLEVLRMGGQALGLFFVRSIERGERVQLAMLARGDRVVRYRGKLKHLDTLYMAMLTAITFWWVVI